MTSEGMLGLFQLDTAPGYRRVSMVIEKAIVEGMLKSGDVLPIESVLAEQLGVNRSTLREGLRSLEDAGLVRRGHGKRLIVSVPDSDEMAWVNTRALWLRQVSFNDLWNIQIVVEPLCARLAAEHLSARLSRKLKANLAATEAKLNDDAALILLDIEFHRLIAEATANQALPIVTAPIANLLFGATQKLYQKVPVARHRLLEAHHHIFKSLSSGQAAEAGKWMTRHVEDFRRGYIVGGMDLDAPIPIRPPRKL